MVNIEFFHEILGKGGVVISANLPDGYSFNRVELLNKINRGVCPLTQKQICHGYHEYPEFMIYLVSYDNRVTNKVLGRYFESAIVFSGMMLEKEKRNRDEIRQNFKRLRHNIINHNTNIIQEFEKAFPFHRDGKGGHKKTLEYVENKLKSDSRASGISILKAIKSANLLKSDIDVYDMLNDKNPYLEIDRHSIHKVINGILQTFWLDLREKEVQISLAECRQMVLVDYRSISVILIHLFDNLTKYVLPKSLLEIKFDIGPGVVKILLEMTSLKITDMDMKSLFSEGYSGEFAVKLGRSGSGLGMSTVKSLMELNNGKISIERNIDPNKIEVKMKIPFERNQFVLKLPC